MTTATRPAHFGRYYATAPARTDADGSRHWASRGANFLVVVTQAAPGAVLEREDNADEYMLLLPEDVPARIEASTEQVQTAGDSLTILPPGASRITLPDGGWAYRIFSNKAEDLLPLADNAQDYADGAPDVAPLVPWPDPVGGFKVRHYPLADYRKPDSSLRLFRSTNLMVNVFVPQMKARDTSKMTPHSHTDFEQGSLTLSGSFVHHLRYPWTPDMRTWRDDEHGKMDSPSLIVITPNVIHTTETVTTGNPIRLVDVFSPPRVDFSLKPGWINNADEYPLPPAVAEQLARGEQAPAAA
jgi:hypothetical protein